MTDHNKGLQLPKTDEDMAFGRLLKFWRSVRRISQEELAYRIDSASRHISRLEKGGAHPSKAMVEAIAGALSLQRGDCINLLFAAGYIAESGEVDLHAPDMSSQREEILRSLKALDPHPTVAVDLIGNILAVNKAWVGFEQKLISSEGQSPASNFLELLFDHADGQVNSQDLEGKLSTLLLAVQQSVLFCGDEKLQAFLDRLLSSPSIPADWQQRAANRQVASNFCIGLLVDEVPQTFFLQTQTKNLLGPLTFTTRPDILIVTFYPECEYLDLTFLVSDEIKHPLLFY